MTKKPKSAHDPETEFVALITTDEKYADAFAAEEADKPHQLEVRVAKVGAEFHVIVRHEA